MLQATVLGHGASPGYLVLARSRNAPGPSSPNPRVQANPAPSSPCSHSLTPPPSLLPGQSPMSDEALTWRNRTVTWSRGVEIVRVFSYEEGKEDVAFAAFVWFRPHGCDTVGGSSSTLASQSPSTKIPSSPIYESSNTDGVSTFGPFHNSQSAVWGTPTLSSETLSRPHDLERTLVVFLQTRAHVYFASGQNITVTLPFVVDNCWSLSTGGAILQRALERRELRQRTNSRIGPRRSSLASTLDRTGVSVLDDFVDLEDESAPELPRLYTITELFGEPKVVVEGIVDGGLARGSPARLRPGSQAIQIPSSYTVVHVSPAPYPFVIAFDHERGGFICYRRAQVPLAPVENAPQTPAARHLRPDELLRQNDSIQPPAVALRRSTRASLGRTASQTVADRRLSGAGPDLLDRTRRRVSRMSSANELEPIQADLLESRASFGPTGSKQLSSSAVDARRPRGSSFGSEGKSRRLSSVGAAMPKHTREDLHDYPRTALHVVAEDLRDTTMMMGLERDEIDVRSDIVVDRIWEWRPPGNKVDTDSIRVFLSENRSAEFVYLNLLMAIDDYPPSLFTFSVELVDGPTRYIFNEVRATHCSTAVPIVATRPNVLDTLVLGCDGDLQLLTAGGRQTPVDIPRVLTADGRDEVTTKFASSLSMMLDGDGASLSSQRRVVDLVDASESKATVVYSDGDRVRVSLDFTLPLGLARSSLEALSYVLPRDDFANLSNSYLAELQQERRRSRLDDPQLQWQVFVKVLSQLCGLVQPSMTGAVRSATFSCRSVQADPIMRRLADRLQRRSLGQTTENELVAPNPLAVRALLGLHLVAQDCRLSTTREQDLILIVPLLTRLASALGRWDWVDYWSRLMPDSVSGSSLLTSSTTVDTTLLDHFNEPPDVLLYLSRLLACHQKPFPSPQSCAADASSLGSPNPCSQTKTLCNIYSRLTPETAVSGSAVPPQSRALKAVLFMVNAGLHNAWLSDLPFGVGLPILEMMRVCQMSPPKEASPEVYYFIGRHDLAAMCGDQQASSLDLPMGAEGGPEVPPTVRDILTASIDGVSTKHAHYAALPHVRFGLDKRLDEVERIMQSHMQRTIAVEDPKGASEQEVVQYHQNVVNTIANRTLSITVGQGMLRYGSRSATISDPWEIPLIEVAVKIAPGNQVIQAQLSDEAVEWPCFHNGVSTALSISIDSKGIDASWIASNRPKTLTEDHAGFLFGLGLTGRLRNMTALTTFPYLNQRHDITSVGMLLGLGASFAGSRDMGVTRVVSLHTTAFLPMGSMELNGSPLVQSAALMSLGLIYVGSRNLRIAEVALAEISRLDMPGVDGFSDYREAYAFSSAMTFGLVMLGRGGQSSNEIERRMLAQLQACIYGDAPSVDANRGKRKWSRIDSTITSPGATLALGLMYLRSGRKDIAAMLEIPSTALSLENVRPDQLLLRTFARALILWDDVKGTMDWVDEQLPQFIGALHNGHKRTSGMELNTEMAYFNIIAGACLGIGLRFASTANEAAHSVIIAFFGVLGKAAAGQSMTYEGRIRRNTARQALNIVTLALAVLMSGTGELNVMRRLRVSHGQEGVGVTYGSHMAMHMALGLLFLGRGYFTLGNSNLAIAALSISFFPRFLASSSDNKAYPQAFRHLWALAVEPRCLIARDVDTRQSIFLPIKVKIRGRQGEQNLISPTLVGPFDTIASISVDSPRYWNLTYDLSNPRDRQSLVRSRTIWVKRKSGFLDYSADPKGYRNMFVRAGTMSGFDVHFDLISRAAPLQLPPDEVIDLITSHADDPVTTAVVKRFTGDTWLESFMRYVLFECVSLDKRDMLTVYLSMALGLEACDGLALERISQIALLQRFYASSLYDREYVLAGPGAGEKKQAIVRQTFLNALYRRLSRDEGDYESSCKAYFTEEADAAAHRATHIAKYLARNNVPPLRLLEGLRRLVNVSAGVLPQQEAELRMRKVVERYWQEVVGQYDAPGVDSSAQVGLWKLSSMRDAYEAWTERMSQ